jgi:hypothetical protein
MGEWLHRYEASGINTAKKDRQLRCDQRVLNRGLSDEKLTGIAISGGWAR